MTRKSEILVITKITGRRIIKYVSQYTICIKNYNNNISLFSNFYILIYEMNKALFKPCNFK